MSEESQETDYEFSQERKARNREYNERRKEQGDEEE
jgi:hypothetical protein